MNKSKRKLEKKSGIKNNFLGGFARINVIDNVHDRRFRKVAESYFWYGLYVERNILLAFKNDMSMADKFLEAIKSLADFLSTHIYHLRYDYENDAETCGYFKDVIDEAVLYLNNRENRNPKYVYDCIYPYDLKVCSVLFDSCHDQLTCLRDYAFRFGLLPSSFLKISLERVNVLKFVISNMYPSARCDFVVKYGFDKFDCCVFNYKSKDGESFFEKEANKGSVYLYFNVLDIDFDLKKEMHEVEAVINIAKKPIRRNYGNASNASVQVCVNYNHDDFSKKYVLEIVERGVLAYQNWACPSLVKNCHEVIDLAYCVNVLKSEQVSGEARAVGVWMWDLVFFDKLKIVDSIELVRASEINHCRKNSDDRALRRDYDLAQACVESGRLLKYSDLNKK